MDLVTDCVARERSANTPNKHGTQFNHQFQELGYSSTSHKVTGHHEVIPPSRSYTNAGSSFEDVRGIEQPSKQACGKVGTTFFKFIRFLLQMPADVIRGDHLDIPLVHIPLFTQRLADRTRTSAQKSAYRPRLDDAIVVPIDAIGDGRKVPCWCDHHHPSTASSPLFGG